jgi:hypothetical protein
MKGKIQWSLFTQSEYNLLVMCLCLSIPHKTKKHSISCALKMNRCDIYIKAFNPVTSMPVISR